MRKLINPIFNLKALQSFLPIFNEKTEHFLKGLENEVGKSAFDVKPYAANCTLEAICGECDEIRYLIENPTNINSFDQPL